VIARLEGVLIEQHPTRVVIDVKGVGYEVHIPLSTFTELPDAGKTVALRIHTHATEGAIQLFGFASEAERAAFSLLLRANRVGPRLAQTILSGISPVSLLDAVRAGDVRALRAVPGVGAKMAERILVELRDRADELAAVCGDAAARPVATGEDGGACDETLSALLNLGYARAEAERIVTEAAAELGEGATLETLVRASLARLAR
jgi:Holliday junction DNA helicase RuvA